MRSWLIPTLSLLAAFAAAPHPATAQETVTVFAAASMRNALDDANAAFDLVRAAAVQLAALEGQPALPAAQQRSRDDDQAYQRCSGKQ